MRTCGVHVLQVMELAFATLASEGATNATVASAVSAEVVTWPERFLPWANYSVDGPLAGLGELPLLARMAMLPLTARLLTPSAHAALDTLFFAWLAPRSRVEWAGAEDSWRAVDGSENLDATRKASLYLSALALNRTQPTRVVTRDDEATVADHAAAWERHWAAYFRNRASAGIGVEMGSPTYGKYAVQNYLNIADLSPNIGVLAESFLQLWFADAAHAFLPQHGVRGGAHNRV